MAPQHPDEKQLRLYVAARLDDGQVKVIEEHLARCPQCTKRVSEIEDSPQDPLLQKIKAAAASDSDSSEMAASNARPPKADRPESNLLIAGDVLGGNLRLEEKLGRGGMGEAWKVYDRTADRYVVLKFVPGEIQHLKEAVDSVRSSFQKIHALQHQHICPVYSLVDDPKYGLYIVMKYIDGMTLSKYRRRLADKRTKLPFNDIVQILWAVAKGLDYAYECKVIHRDIKPGNIMIGRKDGVQIIDFGLAEEIQSLLSQASGSVAMSSSGTRPYMAPEQWLGRIQDARTDQYALAVTAYELFAGHVPFSGSDTELLKSNVLNDSPESIPGLPEHVNAALLKALSKKRDDRYENCKAFVKTLAVKPEPPDSREIKEQKFPDGAVSINDLPSDQASEGNIPPVWIPDTFSSKPKPPSIASSSVSSPKRGLPSWVLPTISALAMLVVCLAVFLGYLAWDRQQQPENEFVAAKTTDWKDEPTVEPEAAEEEPQPLTPQPEAPPDTVAPESPPVDELENPTANEASEPPFQSAFANIFEAAEKGTVQDVEYFVQGGADVNAKDENGGTPLCTAAWGNPDVEVLKYLIAQGADVNVKKVDGQTPLGLADTEEKKAILRAVIEKNETETAADPPSSLRDIFEAASKGEIQDIEHFLKNGVDVNVRNNGDSTPLHFAARDNPNVGVLKHLVSRGGDVDAKNNSDDTLLHWAAFRNTVEALKYLISQGMDVNAKTRHGLTPLHSAAQNNTNVEVFEYLISQKANVDAKTSTDGTPLHIAAARNPNAEVLKCLISQGADINAKTTDGKTPLGMADTEEKRTILRAAMEPAEATELRRQFEEAVRQAQTPYREELEKELELAKKQKRLQLVSVLEAEREHLDSENLTELTPFTPEKRTLLNVKNRYKKQMETARDNYLKEMDSLAEELDRNARTDDALNVRNISDRLCGRLNERSYLIEPKFSLISPKRSQIAPVPVIRMTMELHANGKGRFGASRGMSTNSPEPLFPSTSFPMSAFPKAQAFRGENGMGRVVYDFRNADSLATWDKSGWTFMFFHSMIDTRRQTLRFESSKLDSVKPGHRASFSLHKFAEFPVRVTVETAVNSKGYCPLLYIWLTPGQGERSYVSMWRQGLTEKFLRSHYRRIHPDGTWSDVTFPNIEIGGNQPVWTSF